MSEWDPIEDGKHARVRAVWNVEDHWPDDLTGPFEAVAAAFGFEDWDALRLGTTPDMIPQLKAIAGPNGYAILKAMLAKRS